MAKDVKTGTKPTGNFKFVDGPDMNMPRDNSGGPADDGGSELQCSTCFGDGGKIVGAKSYLTNGGS